MKLSLATHEAELVANGVPALHDKVSASAFIVAGLNLQEQQQVVSVSHFETRLITFTDAELSSMSKTQIFGHQHRKPSCSINVPAYTAMSLDSEPFKVSICRLPPLRPETPS